MRRGATTTMPLIRDGKEYLNGQESAEFMEVSFMTFQKIEDTHPELKRLHFIGQRGVFYDKEVLEKIKNTPIEPPQ